MSVTTRILSLALSLVPAVAHGAPLVLTFTEAVYQDAKEAPFRGPEGVACNDAGAVVVADTGNARLVSFTGKDGSLGPGNEIKAPQIVAPVRVQLDSKGNTVFLDRRGNRIVRLDPKGTYLGTFEVKTGVSGDVSPVAFRVDPEDNVWILDGAGARVIVVGADGAVKRIIALPSRGALFTDVAFDGGITYVLDAMGVMLWAAEPAATSFTPLSKSLKEEMSFPGYLTIWKGKVLVVDQVGGGIVVLGKDGTFQGRQLSLGVSEGLVNYPGQLCTTEAGDVFIANRNNNRLERFTTMR